MLDISMLNVVGCFCSCMESVGFQSDAADVFVVVKGWAVVKGLKHATLVVKVASRQDACFLVLLYDLLCLAMFAYVVLRVASFLIYTSMSSVTNCSACIGNRHSWHRC